MIVVPTKNGRNYVVRLMDSFRLYGTGGHEICFVDMGSDWPRPIQLLKDYERRKQARVVWAGPGYESKALREAYYRYPRESCYLCLQDTCEVVCTDWWAPLQDAVTHGEVGAVWKGHQLYRQMIPWEYEYIAKCYGRYEEPGCCVFGNMVACSWQVLREMDERGWLKHVANRKLESCAWERIWPMLFNRLGLTIYDNAMRGIKKVYGNR